MSIVCRTLAKNLDGFEGFHFHQLRHAYTSNLLSNGAAPKDVQELLGHSDVGATMNVYAHAIREVKRTSARLLDKVAGNDWIHSEKTFPCKLPVRAKQGKIHSNSLYEA